MNIKKTKVEIIDFLKDYCSEEWIFLIKNYIQIEKYKKDERIFSEGDEVKGIYFINSGKIKIVSHFNRESERIMRLSNPGDFLGHRSFKTDLFPISAIALTDVSVTFIPLAIYLKMLTTNPGFSIFMLEFYANDLRITEERMINIIHNDVIVRIGIIVIMLLDAYGYENKKSKRLSFMLTRLDFANFAGTTYESVVRNLTKLEEMGFLQIDGKSLIILKEKELRKFIKEKN